MHVVTAVFPDRDTAVATREALGNEHYRYRWLGVTKPADHVAHDDGAASPETHELVEGSDGAVGAIGRFLSGAGSSLRKALEDHGVAEADADAIDLATPPHGAVLVVHAADERLAEATHLLEAAGGRVYGNALSDTFQSAAFGTAGDPNATSDLFPAADTSPVVAPLPLSTLGTPASADLAGVTTTVNATAPHEARPTTTLAGFDAPPPVEREEIFTERRRTPSV